MGRHTRLRPGLPSRSPHTPAKAERQSPARLCRLEGSVGGCLCPCSWHFLLLLVLPSLTQPTPEKWASDTLEWESSSCRGFATGARPLAEPGMSTLVLALGHEGRLTWKVTLWDTETVLRLCPINPWSPAGVRGLFQPGLGWARDLWCSGEGVCSGPQAELQSPPPSPAPAPPSAPGQDTGLCPCWGREETGPTGLWGLAWPLCYLQKQVTSLDPLALRKLPGSQQFSPGALLPVVQRVPRTPQQVPEGLTSPPSLGRPGGGGLF